MKRGITFSILWAVGFAAVTFLAEMVAYAVLGFAGIASWRPSIVVIIGRSLSFMLFAMPVLGLILGLRGTLPGTKQKPETGR